LSLTTTFSESSGRPFPTRASRLGLQLLLALLVVSITGSWVSSGREGGASNAYTPRWQAASFYRFVPGERMVYKLDYTSASASDFRALFQDQKRTGERAQATPLSLAQSFRTTVQGELIATVLDKKEDSASIAYSLRKPDVRLIANGQAAVTEAEKIKTDLSLNVFAAVNLQGNVLQVRFDAGVGDLSRSFVRAILAVTQFAVPVEPAPELSQWETQEDDPNGHYIARYQADPGSCKGAREDPQADPRKFLKTKTRYLQPRRKITQDEFAAATTIIPKGSLAACFDVGKGYLVSLRGTESQVIVIEGKNVASAENSLQMDYVRKETLSPAELVAMREASVARERAVAAVPLFVIQSEEASEESIERTELGNATLESLLADLAKVEASTGEIDDTPLYLKFKALVYLHPESSTRLGTMLAKADAKRATMRILTGALGAVGHAEAQTALVTAVRARREEWAALFMLIPALGGVSSPTQMAEDTLRDLAFNSPNSDIASTAQLTLGSIARNLAETSPQRASKIVDSFIKQIESSPSADTTRQMLLVLGNAGSTRAFSTIARFLTNSSPALRAAAASALRWISFDQVDPLLIETLTSDSEGEVRLEAAVALGFREMTEATFKTQKQAFVTDKDDKVRLAVLRNLWKAHETFPEVRRLVKEAAKTDPSKEVRKAAAEIVAMYPESYFDKNNQQK
jgi:HEAT repeats